MMGFFGKIFKKKDSYDDLDLDDFKSSLDTGSGQSSFSQDKGSFGSGSSLADHEYSGHGQGFQSQQPRQPYYQHQEQPAQQAGSIQKEFEIINSKLEMLKVLLESINQRLYALEKQNEKRRF
jgi:hypothetical protein